jgi:signal transduction histidine kinase
VEPVLDAQNEERFRANRFELVSRLADDLAHEIKNPLNSIVINLEVLKVRIARADSDGALGRIAVIEQETRRLNHLVDLLLLLLRPARGEAASLALDQAFDEILPLVEAQMRLARNEFRSDCSAPVSVPVRSDIFKFAMLNLITALHERLGEAGGGLVLHCDADDVSVTVRVSADPVAALAEIDAAYERAVHFARDLLAPCGGNVESADNGVVVVLPRGPGL